MHSSTDGSSDRRLTRIPQVRSLVGCHQSRDYPPGRPPDPPFLGLRQSLASLELSGSGKVSAVRVGVIRGRDGATIGLSPYGGGYWRLVELFNPLPGAGFLLRGPLPDSQVPQSGVSPLTALRVPCGD